MAEDLKITAITKEEKYKELIPQVKALLQGEDDIIANLANVCAALKYGMKFFWVGFYIAKNSELVLGPFQGPIACTRIALGKGVCGTSWKNKETIIVKDVNQFPGHISCSALSQSEIVVPVFDTKNNVIAVLDVDSDELNNFDEVDAKYLKEIVESLNF
jgi:GAF domain-containing protein